ncbi:hypothetical protein EON65_18235 [archaeon]|nr:MAG: hypothetical protein EON65_18235 [archaeon]
MSINAVQHSMTLDFELKEVCVERAPDQLPQKMLDQPETFNDVHPVGLPHAYQSLANCSDGHGESDEEEDNKSIGTEVLQYKHSDREDEPIQASRMLSSSTVQTMQEDYMIGFVSEDVSAPGSVEAVPRKLSPIEENSYSEKSSSKSGHSFPCDRPPSSEGRANGEDRTPVEVASKASLQSFVHVGEGDSLKEDSNRRFSFSSISSMSLKRRMSVIRQQAATAECEVCSFGLSFLTSKGSVKKKAPSVLKKLVIPNHQDAAEIQQNIVKDNAKTGNLQAVARPRSRTSSCAIM